MSAQQWQTPVVTESRPNQEAERLRCFLLEVEIWGRNLDIPLGCFASTGNPYYAWQAIRICVKHKKEFPDELIAYLGECADRMLSDEAEKARDVRKVLPWILGFPKKHGPGNLLNPDDDPDNRQGFALTFMVKIAQGEKPSDALKNAATEILGKECVDKADEKTLQRWIRSEIGLQRWPRTAEEWDYVKRRFARDIHQTRTLLADRKIASGT